LVSNNSAEYEAALHGLRITAELGVKCLMVFGDSALVINQVNNGPTLARRWTLTTPRS
jgi:ribonuclease HI